MYVDVIVSTGSVRWMHRRTPQAIKRKVQWTRYTPSDEAHSFLQLKGPSVTLLTFPWTWNAWVLSYSSAQRWPGFNGTDRGLFPLGKGNNFSPVRTTAVVDRNNKIGFEDAYCGSCTHGGTNQILLLALIDSTAIPGVDVEIWRWLVVCTRRLVQSYSSFNFQPFNLTQLVFTYQDRERLTKERENIN